MPPHPLGLCLTSGGFLPLILAHDSLLKRTGGTPTRYSSRRWRQPQQCSRALEVATGTDKRQASGGVSWAPSSRHPPAHIGPTSSPWNRRAFRTPLLPRVSPDSPKVKGPQGREASHSRDLDALFCRNLVPSQGTPATPSCPFPHPEGGRQGQVATLALSLPDGLPRTRSFLPLCTRLPPEGVLIRASFAKFRKINLWETEEIF